MMANNPIRCKYCNVSTPMRGLKVTEELLAHGGIQSVIICPKCGVRYLIGTTTAKGMKIRSELDQLRTRHDRRATRRSEMLRRAFTKEFHPAPPGTLAPKVETQP